MWDWPWVKCRFENSTSQHGNGDALYKLIGNDSKFLVKYRESNINRKYVSLIADENYNVQGNNNVYNISKMSDLLKNLVFKLTHIFIK